MLDFRYSFKLLFKRFTCGINFKFIFLDRNIYYVVFLLLSLGLFSLEFGYFEKIY